MEREQNKERRVTVVYRPLPAEATAVGTMFGGHLMRHMDDVGSTCAVRYARRKLVTAAVEHMSFISPVRPGDILFCHASVNHVWGSSMEVGIRVEAESPFSGERAHVCTCYLTFVGIDAEGRPTPLPAFEPEDDEDRRRAADAAKRMALSRMEHKGTTPHAGGLNISLLPETFAVCTLAPGASVPVETLFSKQDIAAIVGSSDELFLALTEKRAAALQGSGVGMSVEAGFVCLKVRSDINMDMVGLLASLTTVLAGVNVPVLVFSSASANYLLLRGEYRDRALKVLRNSGHSVGVEGA